MMTKFHHVTMAHVCVYTLFLTLVQHTSVSLANYDRSCDFQSRPHPRGFCGNHLANLMMTLCRTFNNNNSVTKHIVKRQTDRSLDDNLRGIMLNKKDALSYFSKRQTSGSITCECCYHQCNMNELLEYCDLPSSSFNRRPRDQANSLMS